MGKESITMNHRSTARTIPFQCMENDNDKLKMKKDEEHKRHIFLLRQLQQKH